MRNRFYILILVAEVLVHVRFLKALVIDIHFLTAAVCNTRLLVTVGHRFTSGGKVITRMSVMLNSASAVKVNS